MTTIAELGLSVGRHERGKYNHLVDVRGVGVAHRSFRDAARACCTGFTVIQPSIELNARRAASVHALNAAGELTCTHQINEWGFLDTPIVLTNTPSVGRAYDGVSNWLMRRKPSIGESDGVVIPVVGECDDSVLHDPRIAAWGQVELDAALDESLATAMHSMAGEEISAAALEQGDVGGGTGMMTFELKAGIGSASRVIEVEGQRFTIGVLLQCNFGLRSQLTVLGRNIGATLSKPLPKLHREGSCLGVLATDAPLSPLGLQRLAKRIGLGLARAGSHAHHGSGEIFLAFSTAEKSVHELAWNTQQWNPFLQAAVEASEESVYNALLCAHAVDNARASVAALEPADLNAIDLVSV